MSTTNYRGYVLNDQNNTPCFPIERTLQEKIIDDIHTLQISTNIEDIIIVNCIEDLRDISTFNTSVYVISYNRIEIDNNGLLLGKPFGGGLFNFVSTVNYAEDGGIYFESNITSNGRWKRSVLDKIDIRYFGALGDGITDDYTNIINADSFCHANSMTLVLSSGTYLTNSNVLLSSSFEINHGFILKHGTQTVNVSGILLNDPLFTFFDGSGLVTFSNTSIEHSRPEWFGPNNSDSIQKAINSSYTVKFYKNTYTAVDIELPIRPIRLIGEGYQTTKITAEGSGDSLFYRHNITLVEAIQVENIFFDGNYIVNYIFNIFTGKSGRFIQNRFDNPKIACLKFGDSIITTGMNYENNIIENEFRAGYHIWEERSLYGILVFYFTDNLISGNIMSNFKEAGVYESGAHNTYNNNHVWSFDSINNPSNLVGVSDEYTYAAFNIRSGGILYGNYVDTAKYGIVFRGDDNTAHDNFFFYINVPISAGYCIQIPGTTQKYGYNITNNYANYAGGVTYRKFIEFTGELKPLIFSCSNNIPIDASPTEYQNFIDGISKFYKSTDFYGSIAFNSLSDNFNKHRFTVGIESTDLVVRSYDISGYSGMIALKISSNNECTAYSKFNFNTLLETKGVYISNYQYAGIRLERDGLLKWNLENDGIDITPGDEIGNNLNLYSYNDNGTLRNKVLKVDRYSNDITFSGKIILGSTFSADSRVYNKISVNSSNLNIYGTNISLNSSEGTVDYTNSALLSSFSYTNMCLTNNRQLLSAIYPVISFFQNSSIIPNFMIQYRWQEYGSNKINSWTNLLCNNPVETYINGTILNIFSTTSGITPPSNSRVNDIIQIRLIRDSNNDSGLFTGIDGFNGTISVLSLNVNYLIDSLGSTTGIDK